MMVVSEWAGRVDEQGMAWLYQDSGQLENIDILNTEIKQKFITIHRISSNCVVYMSIRT
jgi:hypothetical protein